VPSDDDEIEVEAPNGTFYFTGKESDRVLLIGGGVGITPMMSVARYLSETGWPGIIHLILGFRTPRDFIFRDEIAGLKACNSNLRVTVTMSQPDSESWSGARGHINPALLAAAVPDIASHLAHICGPPQMMDAVKTALIGLGMPEGQIRTEAFGTVKRNPTASSAVSPEVAGNVFFQASNTTAPIFAGSTILDAADRAGVFIDNACRSGTCGSCRVKLAKGAARMAVEDALSGEDKTDGYILACQAEVTGDVVVDA
jgi:ferredoxin-NADP reductase